MIRILKNNRLFNYLYMKTIEYTGEDYSSTKDIVRYYFFSHQDDSFEEYIKDRKDTLEADKHYAETNNFDISKNEYLILKQEIEEMLTRRDPLEIINILREGNENSVFQNKKELEDYYSDEKDEDKYTYMFQNFERIYYEFYHEDENFRLDLIETPIKKLKAMKF